MNQLLDLVVSGTTHATFADVLPGETYKVYVRSVSEDGVSEPDPPEGLTVHTQPETPVGHLMKEFASSGLCRIIWEKPNKNSVFMVITMSRLNKSVNSDNIYVVPSELNRFYINLIAAVPFKHESYSLSLSAFYKGSISRTIRLEGFVDGIYQERSFHIKKSTMEYYESKKEASYPLNIGTVKRGRALVFVTEGQSMDFQMDLLKLFADLSVRHWIIFDPDVDTIDWYLKEFVMLKEHENIDYFFVFFIGKRLGNGIDTVYVTKDGYFNIFQECHSVFGRLEKNCQKKIPIFVVVSTKVHSDPKHSSDDQKVLSKTVFQNLPLYSDYHFLFGNTISEYDKWNFLKLWVESLIVKCDHMPLEDIAEYVAQSTPFNLDQNGKIPHIVCLLSKKLNLFPGLTKEIPEKPTSSGMGISAQPSKLNWIPRYTGIKSHQNLPDALDKRRITPVYKRKRSRSMTSLPSDFSDRATLFDSLKSKKQKSFSVSAANPLHAKSHQDPVQLDEPEQKVASLPTTSLSEGAVPAQRPTSTPSLSLRVKTPIWPRPSIHWETPTRPWPWWPRLPWETPTRPRPSLQWDTQTWSWPRSGSLESIKSCDSSRPTCSPYEINPSYERVEDVLAVTEKERTSREKEYSGTSSNKSP